AFYEIFHGTFVFFNDKGHSGGCPASDNQPGLHLKNYRTRKKKCRSIFPRSPALICPPLLK
ncbi:hypothetical protein, partial [Holdemania filiformis]|uniref:hypothetical protein n=1 Tax=Holdemania filiformis TaxID=61171 RepID=UPI00242C97B4